MKNDRTPQGGDFLTHTVYASRCVMKHEVADAV